MPFFYRGLLGNLVDVLGDVLEGKYAGFSLHRGPELAISAIKIIVSPLIQHVGRTDPIVAIRLRAEGFQARACTTGGCTGGSQIRTAAECIQTFTRYKLSGMPS